PCSDSESALRLSCEPDGFPLFDELKIGTDRADAFSHLTGGILAQVFFAAGDAQVLDLFRIDSHDAAAGGVNGGGIASGDENAGRFRSTLDRSVTFHANNAIDDRELLRKQMMQVDDGLRNTRPVENVLRPAVDCAGDQTEQVFHRKR